MRPGRFEPELFGDDQCFVKNLADGLVWHRTGCRPIYGDTDRSGMVYHANYLRYFELARGTLMRDMGCPYTEIEADGYVYPVIELGIKFHAPLYYDEAVWINTRPGELGKAWLKFHYIITNSVTGSIVCSGFTEHCAINSRGRPVALDKKTSDLLKNFPAPVQKA
ncbi:MAG: acyl-CoA thioesterase [Desulfobacteraceae bacterium]|nr:acyl-CoA thioesterase [Desulfobacteraceae bacterium]